MVDKNKWEIIETFPRYRRESLFGSRVVPCYEDRPNDCTELLANSVERNPTGEAIVCEDVRVTYSQFEELVTNAYADLQKNGMGAGDRVACLMENSAEYVVYVFAILKLRAIVVPISIKESQRGIAHILEDAQARCLVCHAKLEHLISKDILEGDRLFSVIALHGFEDIPTKDPSQKPSAVTARTDPEDTAFLMYTSGTTGTPKGASVTHVNAMHSIINYKSAMRLGQDDRSILAVPLSHVTGLVAQLLTIVGASGALVIMRDFRADAFVGLAEKERTTHTIIVPAMFNLILMSEKLRSADLSAWRASGYGGAVMPAATLHKIANELPGLNLYNCYGATETTSPAAIMPAMHAKTRPTQVGLPLPCCDILIVDGDGKELPSGDLGEVWISGPMVVPGYWNNPVANESEFIGGYWRSGDVGWIDESGFLSVVDRIKDVINRGGYKIYASEVEGILLENKHVIDCAVVAFSCSVLGERVAAFVRKTGELDTDELKHFCADNLAEYKVPEHIVAIEEIPRNANGKVLKRKLREVADEQFRRQ